MERGYVERNGDYCKNRDVQMMGAEYSDKLSKKKVKYKEDISASVYIEGLHTI